MPCGIVTLEIFIDHWFDGDVGHAGDNDDGDDNVRYTSCLPLSRKYLQRSNLSTTHYLHPHQNMKWQEFVYIIAMFKKSYKV